MYGLSTKLHRVQTTISNRIILFLLIQYCRGRASSKKNLIKNCTKNKKVTFNLHYICLSMVNVNFLKIGQS